MVVGNVWLVPRIPLKGIAAGAVDTAGDATLTAVGAVTTLVAVTVGNLIVLRVLKLSSVNSLAARLGLWINCPSVVPELATLAAVKGAKMPGLR